MDGQLTLRDGVDASVRYSIGILTPLFQSALKKLLLMALLRGFIGSPRNEQNETLEI